MRFYVSGNWGWGVIWGLEGSVFPRAMVMALPNAIIALLLCLRRDPSDADEALADNARNLLGGFTGVLFFVLYFRSNVAYSRWWEGGTLLQQTRGEWFNAYSSLIAFSTTDPKMADKVEEFHHMLARLVSLLFSAALQQVSPCHDTPFEILDTFGIEPESLRFLSESSDKVEVLLQWIQRSTIMNMYSGVLPIPPPVMSRAFQEISRGIVNLQNARKIADFPFPFPYAQTSVIMLLIHWAICPILASYLLNPVLATVMCFCLVFFVWCINFIALQLEFPFGHGENDLPMQQFQSDWNKSVGTLLARRAQHPPRFEFQPTVHRRLETVMSDGNMPKNDANRLPSTWLTQIEDVNRVNTRDRGSQSLAEPRKTRGSTQAAAPAPKRASMATGNQTIGNRSVKAGDSEQELTAVVVEKQLDTGEPAARDPAIEPSKVTKYASLDSAGILSPKVKTVASMDTTATLSSWQPAGPKMKKVDAMHDTERPTVKTMGSMDTTAGLTSWRTSVRTDVTQVPSMTPVQADLEDAAAPARAEAPAAAARERREEPARERRENSPDSPSPRSPSPGSMSPRIQSLEGDAPVEAEGAAPVPSGPWFPLNSLSHRFSRYSAVSFRSSTNARYEPSAYEGRNSVSREQESDETQANASSSDAGVIRSSSVASHRSAIKRAAHFANTVEYSAEASGERERHSMESI